jgi:AraC-like DNA-binding protein
MDQRRNHEILASMTEHTKRRPLHRFPVVETSDPKAFGDAITAEFGARPLLIDVGSRPFRASANHLVLASGDIAFSSATASVEVQFPAVSLFKQHFTQQRNGRTRFGGQQFEVTSAQTVVIPAGVEAIHQYDAEFEQLTYRVSPSALQSKLSAIVGMPVAGRLEFATPSHFADPSLRRLKRLLEFVVTELDTATVPPAALAEFEQLLIISFLSGNLHNFSDLMAREHPPPAKWQVQLAEEYLEANWNRPVTVEALAAETGTSTRSLFKAFRDSRNCSPMMFVRGIRLAHARRMLQQPDAATTVMTVAFACGFLNPGHFAQHYRLAFGELPSATLAAARRRS